MKILSRRPLVQIAEGICGRIEPGPGNKVLWLHGYTLDSSSWGNLWSLLPGWHHIGIELPYHGASPAIAGENNLRHLGVRLGNFCNQYGIRHLVALSFGTITALQIAIEFPEFFSAIVLGAPAIAGGPQDSVMTRVYSQIIMQYQQGQADKIYDLWTGSPAWNGIDKLPGLESALFAIVARHRWQELQSYRHMQLFTSPPQRIEQLTKIRTPLLILLGEHEMPAFKKCAAIIEQYLPNCHCEILADTYHLCMLQSPQLCAPFIDRHLAQHSEK